MLLPGIVLTIIFCYVPMYGITLAFKDFSFRKGIFGSPWCDPLFKNFEALFRAGMSLDFRHGFAPP